MKQTATFVRGSLLACSLIFKTSDSSKQRRHYYPIGMKTTKRSSFRWYFLFAIHFLLFSCQAKQHMETNKFKWLGTLSAPKEYPVEVYKGEISSNDYSYGFDPIWGVFNSGWGVNAGMMSTENEPANLPNRLSITWYSVVEDKYYTGAWNVDPSKILELIQKNESDKETEFKFMIGLAPGGLVNFWIIGENQQLIATYQAERTELTPENTDETFEHHFRQEYRESAYDLKEIFEEEDYYNLTQEGGIPVSWYAEANRLYAWGIIVKGLENENIQTCFYQTFNGENLIKSYAEMQNVSPNKSLPSKVFVTWITAENIKMIAVVDFEYAQIQEAFKQADTEQVKQLQLIIEPKNQKVEVQLLASNKQIDVEVKKSIVTTE